MLPACHKNNLVPTLCVGTHIPGHPLCGSALRRDLPTTVPSESSMRRLLHLSLVAVVTLLLTTPAFAAKKNKDKGRHDPAASIKKKLDAADLPTDVREKAKKGLADDSPKLKE